MKEKILDALSNVQEPDLGKDLVTLNMVKDISVEGKNIEFTIVLTTPACPLKEHIKNACINAIHLLIDKNLEVKVNFSSNTAHHSKNSILKNVQYIIAVFSGKGGVGKSTIASNLAVSIAQQGARVGLMDADIYGPSVPVMFGLRGERPKMIQVEGKNKIVPIEKFGVKLMSIGFLIDEKQAVVWRGPMVSSAIKQFLTDVEWGTLDYLILDMPPGTGDIHLTLLQTLPLTGALIVTTPQKVAVNDAKKALAMFAQSGINVPVLGIVENMAYFIPKELPENTYFIFGKNGGKNLSEEYEVPFLGQIPLIQSICDHSDNGVPVIMTEDELAKKPFQEFVSQTIRQVSKKAHSLV